MDACNVIDSSLEMNVEQKIEGEAKNTSDASFADIPLEIQSDILSRLPRKSLSRCECVSKHLNDTVTTGAFLLKHSRSYDKQSKLMFVARSSIWGNKSIISFELNDDNSPKTETVVTSNTTASLIRGQQVYFMFSLSYCFYMSNICNDLICLFNPSSTRVGLLNLKTQDFTSLPAVTIKSVDRFRFWYALGFDPVHNVFKVLSIIYGDGTTTKAAILTVGSNYWNTIESIPSSVVEKHTRWFTPNSLCLDGVIYWYHIKMLDNVIVRTISAFDLNRGVFRDNELVMRHTRDTTFRCYLTCLKECPTLVIWKINDDYTEEEVEEYWTLFDHKNPKSAWKKRNFTNDDNCSIKLPYEFHWTAKAGGSTLIRRYSGTTTNSKSSLYSFYDLENYFDME